LFAEGKTKEIDVEKMSAETVSKAVADIDRMVERLDAINKMDTESLTKEERKELKKEVREIKGDLNAYSKSDSEVIAQSAEVAATGRGLYISGGALIIILLLILIL
jgi:nitrogen fixation/metabolism regulation signal transduction histidine kinase